MAYIYVSGFEGGDASSDDATLAGSAVTWDTSTVRTGIYSLKCAPNNQNTQFFRTKTFSASETYVRYYLNINTFPDSANNQSHFVFIAGALGICRIALQSEGNGKRITLMDTTGGNPGSVIGIGTTVLNTGTWYRIEARCKPATATTGIGEIKIDGNTEISVTDGNFGTSLPDNFVFGQGFSSVASYTVFIDDFAVNDSTYPGAGQVVRLLPAGDDTAQFDNPVTSVLHWKNAVAIPFQDTNYNFHASTAAATDLYDLTTASNAGITSNDTINTVWAIWRLKRDTGGTSTHQSAYKINGTEVNSTIGLGTGFLNYTNIYDTVPSVGGAWTDVLLDTFKLGARHAAGAQDTYISKTGANVDYTTGGPPPPVSSVITGVRLLTLLGVG